LLPVWDIRSFSFMPWFVQVTVENPQQKVLLVLVGYILLWPCKKLNKTTSNRGKRIVTIEPSTYKSSDIKLCDTGIVQGKVRITNVINWHSKLNICIFRQFCQTKICQKLHLYGVYRKTFTKYVAFSII